MTEKMQALKSKAQRVREGIAEIQRLRNKQDALFTELLFHCMLWDLGIEPEDVREYRYHSVSLRTGGYSRRQYPNEYNQIILKDGTRFNVDPFLLPEPSQGESSCD